MSLIFIIFRTDSEFCCVSVFTLTKEFNKGAIQCDCICKGSLYFDSLSLFPFLSPSFSLVLYLSLSFFLGELPFFLGHTLNLIFSIFRSDSEFCRESVFTLTTEFNKGAVQCDCSSEGSLNFNCQEFGGQCQCRENVIGRTCSACRPGYYGYPDCKRKLLF